MSRRRPQAELTGTLQVPQRVVVFLQLNFRQAHHAPAAGIVRRQRDVALEGVARRLVAVLLVRDHSEVPPALRPIGLELDGLEVQRHRVVETVLEASLLGGLLGDFEARGRRLGGRCGGRLRLLRGRLRGRGLSGARGRLPGAGYRGRRHRAREHASEGDDSHAHHVHCPVAPWGRFAAAGCAVGESAALAPGCLAWFSAVRRATSARSRSPSPLRFRR